ncbi:MAG: M3 family metallopeptidase [Vicinamibacterales bacterium]
MAADLPSLRAWQGRLSSDGATLADALEKRSELRRAVIKLYVYADLLSDQDTRDSLHQGMTQEMMQLYSALGTESAYFEPEILKVDPARIEAFLSAEPRLAVYAHELRDILRRAAHTLSDSEEKLLAGLGPLASAPGSIYNILSNADFAYPVVALSDGTSAKINHARYTELRSSPNRADRMAIQSVYFSALGEFRRTFGTTMDAQVQKVLFFARARKYDSALEYALDANNVPTSVYRRLIDGINRNLPTFHRFLGLRKRMLGLDELHYYDMYAPLVASVDLRYTPEQASGLIVKALAPLGTEYQRVVAQAFDDRWIDMYPNAGKRSGAILARCVLRRPPVHPDELQREVRRREHAGARARAHDAELSLEHAPAVPVGGLSDLHRGGRVHLQRSAPARSHAAHDRRRRYEAVAARAVPRRGAIHGVPSDAVRRVRAADARDGRERTADHRRCPCRPVPTRSRSATTLTTRASASSTTTCGTSGASSVTSTRSSTSTSTRRHSPRPKRSPRA